jgi:hypothetical protein
MLSSPRGCTRGISGSRPSYRKHAARARCFDPWPVLSVEGASPQVPSLNEVDVDWRCAGVRGLIYQPLAVKERLQGLRAKVPRKYS